MKTLVSALLFGCSISMISCQKDDQLELQQINSRASAVNAGVNSIAAVGDDVISVPRHELALDYWQLDGGGDSFYQNNYYGTPPGLTNYYLGKIEAKASYHIRNLQVMVTVPYQYDWNKNTGIIYKIGSPEIGGMEPWVSFIGKQGDIVNAYTNGHINPTTVTSANQRLSADGNAIFSANEKRTVTTTNAGTITVSAGFDSGVVAVGAQNEQGETVTHVDNENGVHSGELSFSIAVNSTGWTVVGINRYLLTTGL